MCAVTDNDFVRCGAVQGLIMTSMITKRWSIQNVGEPDSWVTVTQVDISDEFVLGRLGHADTPPQ